MKFLVTFRYECVFPQKKKMNVCLILKLNSHWNTTNLMKKYEESHDFVGPNIYVIRTLGK